MRPLLDFGALRRVNKAETRGLGGISDENFELRGPPEYFKRLSGLAGFGVTCRSSREKLAAPRRSSAQGLQPLAVALIVGLPHWITLCAISALLQEIWISWFFG